MIIVQALLAEGNYTHGASKAINSTGILEYEIHEPAQNAYGDYSMIKIGQDYHLFCDYDLADPSPMRMGRFTSSDLDKEFSWSGEMGKGFHPDPSVGFAEGKFYVIMQQKTDFVSDGPWIDTVQARAGADIDGDGNIDQWTEWQNLKEEYSQKPGFARIVDVKEAQLNCQELPESQAFKFEVRTKSKYNDLKGQDIQPLLDSIEINFQ